MNLPPDTDELSQVLERMVTRGGAVVPAPWKEPLRNLAVADGLHDDSWMWPTQHFLRTAVPAKDQADLLRRAIIRSPQYRLHLDLSLCSVIHAVAVAERWNRLEEILFGACNIIAPRLAQLIEWQSRSKRKSPREISSIDWDTTIKSNSDPAFPEWDRQLWGDNRGVQDLFQLLIDLYVPINSQSFVVNENQLATPTLLASLIRAANDGEGISLPDTQISDLEALQSVGLPVRWETRPGSRLCAFIVAPISLFITDHEMVAETCDASSRVPFLAKQSSILPLPQSPAICPWSTESSHSSPISIPPTIEGTADRWPTDAIADTPSWLPLPGVEVLSSASKRRGDSQDADVALLKLASHPLYGFLLQLFVLEGLDRELGEETLSFALPQNRILESAKDWSSTKILYRPREQSQTTGDVKRSGFHTLGTVDEVLPRVAHELAIAGISEPYSGEDFPWTRAIYLMSTAGIIDGRPDRWILTIANFILDRLHGGTLMNDVIRGKRQLRDQVHRVLFTLWQEASSRSSKESIPA